MNNIFKRVFSSRKKDDDDENTTPDDSSQTDIPDGLTPPILVREPGASVTTQPLPEGGDNPGGQSPLSASNTEAPIGDPQTGSHASSVSPESTPGNPVPTASQLDGRGPVSTAPASDPTASPPAAPTPVSTLQDPSLAGPQPDPLPSPAATVPGPSQADLDAAAEAALMAAAVTAAAGEQERYETDLRSVQEYDAESQRWLRLAARLKSGIEEAEQTCQSRAQVGFQALPEDLKQQIGSRQTGIDLVANKMLAQAKMLKLTERDNPSRLEPPRSADQFREMLRPDEPADERQSRIEYAQEEASSRAYRVVSEWRGFARNTQKAFTSHVGGAVVPAIEGLETGASNARELVKKLKGEYPEWASALNAWYETYDLCREPILAALETVGIRQMEITRGTQPDYARHRAAGSEYCDDPGIAEEAILAIQRNGYELQVEGGEPTVIREAWVIIATKIKEE